MKRIMRGLLGLLIAIVLTCNASALPVHATFSDLTRNGVNFNLGKGNWVEVYSKIPGKKGLTKFYAKITKYRKSTFPPPKKTGSSSTANQLAATNTVVVTIQVQIPKLLSKKQAKKLLEAGHDYIDYLDVLVVDKKTGENLDTSATSEDGLNNHDVSVTQTEWKGFKPQKLAWSNGTVYQYYVSYVKTVIIKYPDTYTRACVGICGTHVGDYDKMTDWNEAFIKGYTVLSDTTHVKLGKKGTTKKLAHFFQLKK